MKRDRKFELLLYPDSESYDCDRVLQLATNGYFVQWAYALHYADTTDGGELKKAHIHFYGKLNDVRDPAVIARDLGLPLPSLANIKSWKSACRYLCHLDNPEKYQYSPDDVISNFDFLSCYSIPDDQQARMICDYILNNCVRRVSDLTVWALNNGCYSGLRRGMAIWSQILKEN